MPPTTLPLVFNHLAGEEIPTKHKETLRQLYSSAKIPIERLIERYKLGKLIIIKILEYDAPERLESVELEDPPSFRYTSRSNY